MLEDFFFLPKTVLPKKQKKAEKQKSHDFFLSVSCPSPPRCQIHERLHTPTGFHINMALFEIYTQIVKNSELLSVRSSVSMLIQ